MNRHGVQGGAPPIAPHHRSQSSYNGPMPIPAQGSGQIRDRTSSFGTGRSPPALPGKNTKHVPCKFFRQGQCQAGTSCPFSHNLDTMAHLAPCKYFMKGNCKFGAKCALGHYLPNGHRVNKIDLDPYRDMTQRSNGTNGRHQETPLQFPPTNDQFYNPPSSQLVDDDDLLDNIYEPSTQRYGGAFANHNAYDMPVGSPPTSLVGSPPNDTRKWPTALEAPLPPSYTGSVPNYITKGHISGSVPGKFLMTSPPSQASPGIGSPSGMDLGSRIQQTNTKPTPLGTSPAHADTSINGRIMHSHLNQMRNKSAISSSVPVRESLFRTEPDATLDLVPRNIVHDVLTPGEQARRASRSEQELSNSYKESSNGLAIPRRSSAVGSPPAAGSPSRFKSLFDQQEREKSANVGAVGSPLRESWLSNGNSSVSNRQSMQMSGISQALGRMSLDRPESSESSLRPNPLRGGYGRQISSPGLHPRIDEEGDPATFFPMDGDEGSRRVTNVWNDNDPSTSRQSAEDLADRQGVPIRNGNRPIFGFHR